MHGAVGGQAGKGRGGGICAGKGVCFHFVGFAKYFAKLFLFKLFYFVFKPVLVKIIRKGFPRVLRSAHLAKLSPAFCSQSG